jgi:hypothetical protein
MTHGNSVIEALRNSGKSADAAKLTEGLELLAPAGKDFMGV